MRLFEEQTVRLRYLQQGKNLPRRQSETYTRKGGSTMEIQGFINLGDNIFLSEQTGETFVLAEDGYLMAVATNFLYEEMFV